MLGCFLYFLAALVLLGAFLQAIGETGQLILLILALVMGCMWVLRKNQEL